MRAIVIGKRAMQIKSKEYRNYEEKIRMLMAGKYNPFPAGVPLVVTAHFFRPQRRGDLDNSFKALFDVLSGVAYENDSQVVELHAYRWDDKENPRAVVEILPATINALDPVPA